MSKREFPIACQRCKRRLGVWVVAGDDQTSVAMLPPEPSRCFSCSDRTYVETAKEDAA